MAAKSTGFKAVAVMVLIGLFLVGSFLTFLALQRSGWISDRVTLTNLLDDLRSENEALQEENDDLEGQLTEQQGIPNSLLIPVFIFIIILWAAVNLLDNGISGGNLTREKSRMVAREVLRQDIGWTKYDPVRDNRDNGYFSEIGGSGQIVPGETSSKWYGWQFTKILSNGNPVPGHQSVTVLLKSNDPDWVQVEPGLSLDEAAKKHRWSLQKEPIDTELGREVYARIQDQQLTSIAEGVYGGE